MMKTTGATAQRGHCFAAAAALLTLLAGDTGRAVEFAPSVTLSAVVTTLLTFLWVLLTVTLPLFRDADDSLPGKHAEFIHGGAPKNRKRHTSAAWVHVILWMFMCWTVLDTALQNFTVQGAQNLACYFLFVSTVLLVASCARSGDAHRFSRAVIAVGWARAGIYAVDLMRFGFGAQGVFAARSFAIEATLIMAVAIPLSRGSGWAARLLPYALFVEVVFSGSRTAMVVAGLLLACAPLCSTSGARRVRYLLRMSVVAAAGYAGLMHIQVLHDRFFTGDMVPVEGAVVNVSGRDLLWSVVSDHAADSPWVGFGGGSATNFVRQFVRTSGEPHNDWLRIWHDFGLVGLGLWVICFFGLIARCALLARRNAGRNARPHYAALLALLATGVVMITDNILIYYYAMLPLGAVVGLSIADKDATDSAGAAQPRTEQRVAPEKGEGVPVLSSSSV
ncbi:O-antigen ligase family protein [Streptomyces actuosus]|uniref:O-antigen ligase family protein n=1 Tax=Streptomyces actuosus TaxID=1885 RepID=A0ABS2W091_STRAS|nr:O-antigen ligase family protein [Streptomyces actuosus]MBN0048821.1 O-antigen ligase family protein [Streptomyces actuosus]